MIIGAYATIAWKDEDPETDTQSVYFSFGDYNEEEDCDTFGYPDINIFYYAEGEEEILDFMEQDSLSDFVVLDYELNHQENPYV